MRPITADDFLRVDGTGQLRKRSGETILLRAMSIA